MTVIAAMKKDGDMWMVADRLSSWSDITRSDHANATKIIQLEHALIGSSGWGLYGNALSFFVREKPELAALRFQDEWDVETFFRAYHSYFKEHFGLGSSANNEVQKLSGGSFLLTTPDSIYEVASNRDITRFGNYHAVGSGRVTALAVIHALDKPGASAAEILLQAHATACHFIDNCGGEADLKNVTALLSTLKNSDLHVISPEKNSLSA